MTSSDELDVERLARIESLGLDLAVLYVTVAHDLNARTGRFWRWWDQKAEGWRDGDSVDFVDALVDAYLLRLDRNEVEAEVPERTWWGRLRCWYRGHPDAAYSEPYCPRCGLSMTKSVAPEQVGEVPHE